MLFNVDSKSLAKEIKKQNTKQKTFSKAPSPPAGILVETPWLGIPDSSLLP